jgi:hypothetical protein
MHGHMNVKLVPWYQKQSTWLAYQLPPQSPTTLSSAKLCLSLSDLDRLHALWNKKLLQIFKFFYGNKNICVLLKICFHALYAFRGFITLLIVGISLSFSYHIDILHWKWILCWCWIYWSQLIINIETLKHRRLHWKRQPMKKMSNNVVYTVLHSSAFAIKNLWWYLNDVGKYVEEKNYVRRRFNTNLCLCGTPLTCTVSSNPMDMPEILQRCTRLNEL